jgi:hypothetical protein
MQENSINVPEVPKFLPAPDEKTNELYIICTNPLALFWVRQTIPGQIYILEGPQDEKLLRECGDWYKKMTGNLIGGN